MVIEVGRGERDPGREVAAGRGSFVAIVRDRGVRAVQRERAPLAMDEVRIAVRCAGLCRTDVLVAQGRIECDEPRVLGHEVAGVVVERGPRVSVAVGAHVTALPSTPCGRCAGCDASEPCEAALRLGIERDGGFAEELVLPETSVLRVPDTLPFREAAYIEPVTAALAVLRVGLDLASEGAIVGTGRIAELTSRVLECSGARAIRFTSAAPDRAQRGRFAWVIDTEGSEESLVTALWLARTRGTVVLKSRPARSVALPIDDVVRREIVLRGAAYGAFEDAVSLLASGRLVVRDLFGPVRSLAELPALLANAPDESRKLFFAPAGALGSDGPGDGVAACAE